MSFVPATSNRDALTLLAVVAVAFLGLLMRRGSAVPPASGVSGAPPPSDPEDPDEARDGDVGDNGDAGVVALTSDGWAFVPDED